MTKALPPQEKAARARARAQAKAERIRAAQKETARIQKEAARIQKEIDRANKREAAALVRQEKTRGKAREKAEASLEKARMAAIVAREKALEKSAAAKLAKVELAKAKKAARAFEREGGKRKRDQLSLKQKDPAAEKFRQHLLQRVKKGETERAKASKGFDSWKAHTPKKKVIPEPPEPEEEEEKEEKYQKEFEGLDVLGGGGAAGPAAMKTAYGNPRAMALQTVQAMVRHPGIQSGYPYTVWVEAQDGRSAKIPGKGQEMVEAARLAAREWGVEEVRIFAEVKPLQ
jgi:hypothetical protein